MKKPQKFFYCANDFCCASYPTFRIPIEKSAQELQGKRLCDKCYEFGVRLKMGVVVTQKSWRQQMQCNDCNEIYWADNEKQPCPKCGGKGTVLIDYTPFYGNRAGRRKAKKAGLPMEKYVPCPECKK